MKRIPDISGVVLGGGKSRRMGQDKRHLIWDGRKLLDLICSQMGTLFEEVLLVTALPDYEVGGLPVRLVTDVIPDKGSIGGVYTGLKESRNVHCFVVACDMPFLNERVISRLCHMPAADLVIVRLLQGFQPLHARYSKKCLAILEEMIQSGNLKIQNMVRDKRIATRILEESDISDLDPSLTSFMNVNTPSDWEFARKARPS